MILIPIENVFANENWCLLRDFAVCTAFSSFIKRVALLLKMKVLALLLILDCCGLGQKCFGHRQYERLESRRSTEQTVFYDTQTHRGIL